MSDSDNRQNNTVTTNKKSVPEQRPNRAGTLKHQAGQLRSNQADSLLQ